MIAGRHQALGDAEATAAVWVSLLARAAGHRPGNLVDAAAMPKEARQALREALKAVRSFSRTSFAGFTGQVW